MTTEQGSFTVSLIPEHTAVTYSPLEGCEHGMHVNPYKYVPALQRENGFEVPCKGCSRDDAVGITGEAGNDVTTLTPGTPGEVSAACFVITG